MLFTVTIQAIDIQDYVIAIRGNISTMVGLQALYLFYNKHPGVKVTKVLTTKEKEC